MLDCLICADFSPDSDQTTLSPEEALLWIIDSCWICFSFRLLKTLTDGLEWCGLLVDYCDVFITCLDSHSDGTHSLQSIHCWDTDAETHFYKPDEETNSSTSCMSWGWAHFQQMLIFSKLLLEHKPFSAGFMSLNTVLVCVCVCVCVVDVDECVLAAVTGLQACGSGAVCTNTPGSFTCSCPAGFVLALDGHNCVGAFSVCVIHSGMVRQTD